MAGPAYQVPWSLHWEVCPVWRWRLSRTPGPPWSRQTRRRGGWRGRWWKRWRWGANHRGWCPGPRQSRGSQTDCLPCQDDSWSSHYPGQPRQVGGVAGGVAGGPGGPGGGNEHWLPWGVKLSSRLTEPNLTGNKILKDFSQTWISSVGRIQS